MNQVMWRSLFLLLLIWTTGFSSKRVRLGGAEGFVERMGMGTRSLGRGNNGVALSETTPAAYWNPALLAERYREIHYMLQGDKRSLDRAGTGVGVEGGVGQRMGAGLAWAMRTDLAFDVINEEDEDLGSASPAFHMAWVGIGWRLSRRASLGASIGISWANLDVAGFYSDVSMTDELQGNSSLNLGWHYEYSSRWELGVVARNIGFNRELSARWDQSPSRDNSLPSAQTFRPKVLEAGAVYHGKLSGCPAELYLTLLDYQLADTLLVFDPDWHVWRARVGFEWHPIERGSVRLGYDAGQATFGLGYDFRLRIGKTWWPLSVDWAMLYEGYAQNFSPLSVGISGQIP